MSYPVVTVVVAAATLAVALFPPFSVRAEEEGKKEDKLQESITTALPIFSQIAEYRERLFKNGSQYSLPYISDVQSNISGGRAAELFTKDGSRPSSTSTWKS